MSVMVRGEDKNLVSIEDNGMLVFRMESTGSFDFDLTQEYSNRWIMVVAPYETQELRSVTLRNTTSNISITVLISSASGNSLFNTRTVVKDDYEVASFYNNRFFLFCYNYPYEE